MNRLIVALLAIMLSFPVTSAVAGESGAEEVSAFLDSITLGIYVDTSYQYVFDKEDGADLDDGSRPLNQENNSFSINAFTVSIDKTPSMDGGVMDLFGFRADVLFGQQADLLSSAGFGDDVDNVDAYKAYLSFLIPAGESGILIQAGKFVTLAGFELIEAKD
nr:outer membrane beta-barrel protein [Candidatus Dadabacteria bacterium]NIQ16498.1 outer membrane beta-barrel protein [Candidatus Dadabacteria bacterium]